jgi:4-hydroxy-tetrahydrodipicolinate reductase
MDRIKLAVVGVSGRMGKMLVETILANKAFELLVALDQAGSPAIGSDVGNSFGQTTGVIIESDLNALSRADCVIDFTRPDGTMAHLDVCLKFGVQMVIGTTGFDSTQQQKIQEASHKIAIVLSPNMSIGVNVTYSLLAQAAKLLPNYDVEVFEAHHRGKVDAPSGTALQMGKVIAEAQHKEFCHVAEFARHGHTGVREQGMIGFSVARGGDVVGDHHVMFLGDGERIEIRHQSTSRAAYAQGSLVASQFLKSHCSGLFDMKAVLNLN